MDHKTFREKYREYSQLPTPREVWETPEWNEWRQHSVECQDCSNWEAEQNVKARGYKVSDFPCAHLADYVTETCLQHENRDECPDIIISHNERFDEYYIAPRGSDGGEIHILYCPWCGTELPPSKRKLWFDTLKSLGINFPDDDIPERFLKPKWWLNI